jgi:hypothetical protein
MRNNSVNLEPNMLADANTGIDLAVTRILHPYEYWQRPRQDRIEEPMYVAPEPDSDSSMSGARGERARSPAASWQSAALRFTVSSRALRTLFREWIVRILSTARRPENLAYIDPSRSEAESPAPAFRASFAGRQIQSDRNPR